MCIYVQHAGSKIKFRQFQRLVNKYKHMHSRLIKNIHKEKKRFKLHMYMV